MPKRPQDALRPLTIRPHVLVHPEGSALIALGDTQVLCTATLEERVPPWLMGKGRGWVSAEYDMLPRATHTRNARDSHKGKINGRTQEISRLVARALRGVVNLQLLGERTITVDCDVIQADGGTRVASITGGFVALALAQKHLLERKAVKKPFITEAVAAISVGILEGGPQLDLDYGMDSRAHVDMNVIMTTSERLVEIQGTGESRSFARSELDAMVNLAFGALPTLLAAQEAAINTPYSAALGILGAVAPVPTPAP